MRKKENRNRAKKNCDAGKAVLFSSWLMVLINGSDCSKLCPFECNLSFTRGIMICNTIMTDDAMVKQLKRIVKNFMPPDVPTSACQ